MRSEIIKGMVTPETADRLASVAAELDRTISWCVDEAIKHWLTERDKRVANLKAKRS